MLTVDEALQTILQMVQPSPAVQTPLADAFGLVLTEDIISGIDSPPFDKALMDGYAVRAADVVDGKAELKVIEELTAGRVPEKSVSSGVAVRIMTGAPIPDGADAVVQVEHADFDSGTQTVRISTEPLKPGANVMHRGTAMRTGDRILPAGRLLRPQEIGALAELGRYVVQVRPRPKIAVLATGDELVSIDRTPGPGQIRNTNESMLAAQIRRAGGDPIPLGIARDERSHLREKVREGLQFDMLLLSGGVSAGKLDLVPSVLEAAGVRQVFHKVHVKPGKPVWFGFQESPQAHMPQRYVFGLPGNPVSSLVCFELFVRSAIRRQMGIEPAAPQPVRARLVQAHLARGDRPTYHPARLQWTETGPGVQPLQWHGSADLRATADANAMALFPPGERNYAAGDRIDVFLWD